METPQSTGRKNQHSEVIYCDNYILEGFMCNLSEIEDFCEKLYEETNELYWEFKRDSSEDAEPSDDENDLGIDEIVPGTLPMVGPPIYRPDIFIVSLQGAGGDRTVHTRWPEHQLYDNDTYHLGRALRRLFENLRAHPLLAASTGAPLIFFQSPSVGEWNKLNRIWRRRLEQFSKEKLFKLISLSQPKLVITIGINVFDQLASKSGRESGSHMFRTSLKNHRLYARGSLDQTPVVGMSHLTGSQLSHKEVSDIQKYLAEDLDRFVRT